jgi:peptide deformylase
MTEPDPNTPAPEAEEEKPELRLVIWPDETLKMPVAPFPEEGLGTELVRDTAEAMIQAMYKHHGVGLAAQQTGIPFQIFVMDTKWTEEDASKTPRVFLNPRITDIGQGAQQLQWPGEGCLSFPYGYRNPVRRLDKLELEWLDFEGEAHHEWFEGYEAIVIQHEMDHLMGFCFIDRLSSLKRGMALRRARKVRRRYRKGYKGALAKLKHATRTPEYALKRAQAFEQGFREGSK